MKRINLFIGAALLALGFVPATRAVVTEKVDQDTYAEFSPGEFENVSLTSDGHLELAPAMTNLASVTDPIIWAAVQDEKGNVFFGTGNQGKVYKLTPKGELSTFFEPNEVMVHALAIDGKGRLYAATSPNGRVYRLDAERPRRGVLQSGRDLHLGDDVRQGRLAVPGHRRPRKNFARRPDQFHARQGGNLV